MSACPSCGFENADSAKFCSECGTALLSRATLREERKVVTVVFADLVGSTARAEHLDPEDVRAVLSPYHDRLRHELERHGGTVEKFIGDAVVGVFGAPVAHEDDPERAVRAALSIQEAVSELNESDPQLDLEVRVGVHTGDALVALGARPELGEAMVAGDVMNTGARIQAAAPPGGVLVGEATHRATERAIEYSDAMQISAKGKAEPVPAWLALRRRAGFGVDIGGAGRAPLVGRERELDVLLDALARARSGEPQLVTLVGVPGIGKSRLVYELYRRVDDDPDLITWRQGRSLPYGEGVAFWALGEMVKAQAGVLETDDEATAAAKLASSVADLIEDEAEAAWVERNARPLLGLGSEAGSDTGRAGEDAPAAWHRLLEALAESRAAVLVFEDLHWADDGLLDFVDELVDWVRGVPLLVVGTARPELLERRPGWGGGKRNSITLSLSPLSDADTARLVGALLEQTLLPAETQAELLARAGGNPLYAEEFARIQTLGGEEVPDTLQAIVAARIDGLPSEEKSLLQAASVLGKVFWPQAVAVLAGGDRREVETRLRALERKEFVRRERRSAMEGEQQYVFLHALIRDVGYGQLTRAERAEKHRLAAEWIESLGRMDDHADLVAHHYGTALELARAAGLAMTELEQRARTALRHAGDRAARLLAFSAAVRFYTAALELWPADEPERARILLASERAASFIDSQEIDEAELAHARDILLAASDLEGAADAEWVMGQRAWLRGDRETSNQHLARQVSLLADQPASRAKAEALTTLSGRHMLNDDFEDGLLVAEEAVRVAEEVDAYDALAGSLLNSGAALWGRGDWEAGLERLERGLEVAREHGSWQMMRGYGMLRDSLFELGDLTRAAEVLASGREEAARFGMALPARWLRGERAVELYHSGGWDEACEAIDQVVGTDDAPWWFDSEALRVRALIKLGRGDYEGAQEDVSVGLRRARDLQDPQTLYPPIAVGALTRLALGDRAGANAHADELLSLWHARPGQHPRTSWIVELGRALRALDRADDFGAALELVVRRTPWVDGAAALASGENELAVKLFRQIGSRTCESLARVQAGAALASEGRRVEADVHLRIAAAYWTSMGAAAYQHEAEGLLAAAS